MGRQERKESNPVEAAQAIRDYLARCVDNEIPTRVEVAPSVVACVLGISQYTLDQMAQTKQRLIITPHQDQDQLKVAIELKPAPHRYQEAYEDLYYYTQAGISGEHCEEVAKDFDTIPERTRVMWGQEVFESVGVMLSGGCDPEAELPLIQAKLRDLFKDLEPGLQQEVTSRGLAPEMAPVAVAY